MQARKSVHRWLLFSLPLGFLLVFYFYPLVKIVSFSFFADSFGPTKNLAAQLMRPQNLEVLWFTIWQAGLSTLLTLLVGLPGAYVFAKYHFWGKNFLQALLTVPFVLPTLVTATAFQALLGESGLLNTGLQTLLHLPSPVIQMEQTIPFFLLAHVFYNYSLVVRIVSSYWANIDNTMIDSARMLGASPWKCFWKITLPLLTPAISSAAILIFIFCFTSFGVILILGGPSHATLEVEIYRQAIQLFNLPLAASLSLIQIVFNFILMWLHAHSSKKAKVTFFSDAPNVLLAKATRPLAKVFVWANLCFMALLLISPLLALITKSVLGGEGFTLSYYTHLFTLENNSVFFVKPIAALTNSLLFGFTAMLLSLLLGLATSIFLSKTEGTMGNFWDGLVMLPLATSAVTLGFGYIITLNKPPLNLRDSLLLVPIAHALVAFPFVVRCILPSLRRIPENVKEAASLLGARPYEIFRSVELPLIAKAILVAAVFSFSISMGEFGASAFVARPHTPTLPVAIFRFLGQPGDLNYGQAMAMSSILMLVTWLCFWLIGNFDRKRITLAPEQK